MFCSNCGTKAADNARFCHKCGKAFSQDVPEAAVPQPEAPEPEVRTAPAVQPGVVAIAPADQLQDEIAVLENAHGWFAQKLLVYDAFEEACKRLVYYGQGTRNLLWVFGSVCFGISLTFLLDLIFNNSYADPLETLSVVLPVFMIPGLLMIGGGLLIKLINRKRFNAAAEEMHSLSDELMTHYRCLPGLPFAPEYSDPRILEAILVLLHSGSCVNTAHALHQLHSTAGERPARHREELEKLTKQSEHPPVLFFPAKIFHCF